MIYCATEADGAFLGVGRSRGGIGDTLQIQAKNSSTNSYLFYYEVDGAGGQSFLRSRGTKPYDPRQRPWYEAAKASGESVWSDVYLDFDTLLPVITANTPVYDNDTGNLLGVCATDIILSEELNQFLRGLEIGQSGIAFIIEPSGLLIASSTPEPITSGSDEETQLLAASDSENSVIREVTHHLMERWGRLERVESSRLNVVLNGDRQFLEVLRFSDRYSWLGLDCRARRARGRFYGADSQKHANHLALLDLW
ncbi:MAG: hypothetical protein HC838_04470 [Spirulinaceae cyanobacterium RM2_2_10]|nr:hypothetical protein [Spirulinaceae cyanobacterium SM2_1_0]NJO19461.1 hypothetical protein [Spirulinaceae cyanobacterium RM2_2_10]